MDIEFHYHITYIISRRAGFSPENAYIIAYSSQHTDDNNSVYNINVGSPDEYSNYISQTMNILKPQTELMRIYPVFHFLPGSLNEITGDTARRADGKLHLMNTIPDSQNGRMLLSEALNTNDPYRIGIATHTYVDTFAHQNFVGSNDSFNDIAGLIESLIPSIGHADAGHQPDIPNRNWQDRRLVPSHVSINNTERFLRAAGCLFDLYRGRFGDDNDKQALLGNISDAIGDRASAKSTRIKRYRELIGDGFIEYGKNDWFKEAVNFTNVSTTHASSGDTVPVSETRWVWKDNYLESNWFKFQEAIKKHQEYALANIVRPIYGTMEQTTW